MDGDKFCVISVSVNTCACMHRDQKTWRHNAEIGRGEVATGSILRTRLYSTEDLGGGYIKKGSFLTLASNHSLPRTPASRVAIRVWTPE